jgi:tetratricopeptide (TPR) repeat protein
MLAIPYALAQLDSISQAADHYLNAIEAFYEESGRIDRTINHIESGQFFDEFISDEPLDSTGWYWRMEALPEGPQARYLFHLLATHEFQEGLKNYRDLNYLWNNLDRWQQSVEVYANMLETRRLAYEERLPRVQEALSRADIDGMVQRKLEFDAQLNDIEQSGDWLALATAHEPRENPRFVREHSRSRRGSGQDQAVKRRTAVGSRERFQRTPVAYTPRPA